MTKILIITDAWDPQVNGVVTTLKKNIYELKKSGNIVDVIHPYMEGFKRVSIPGYNEIECVYNIKYVYNTLDKYIRFSNYSIHIATHEGPLGSIARHYCKKINIKYTSSYHTKFDDYLYTYLKVPKFISRFVTKHMYKNSHKILVTTESIKKYLSKYCDSEKLVIWNRGVDHNLFKPLPIQVKKETNILLYVGRVSKEKNIEAFLDLKVDGLKVVVGDGPELPRLKEKYGKSVLFVGKKSGTELAEFYKIADVFVFPSKSDTFGIVMLEAMACGTPTAAYPAPGPIDVIKNGISGYLDTDLKKSIEKCLTIDRDIVYNESLNYTWKNCSEIFKNTLI